MYTRPSVGPNFKANEAVSLMVLTDDQEEADRYWNAIVSFASFARDGEVRTGSFGTKGPSEYELALGQRQAEGRW